MMLLQKRRWHEFATIVLLEQAVAQAIVQAAAQAIMQRGAFHIVLAGGNTPRRIYEQLRAAAAHWAAWHIYFGDERCLPAEHTERNSQMAAQAWLHHVAIPPGQIHAIAAERGADNAAKQYAQVLHNIAMFDLVLLGLGEDGHTASLFPGQEWGSAAHAPAVMAVQHAPKPPAQRVTLSAQRLSAARQVMFIVSGMSKQQAIKDWRNDVLLPAAAIAPDNGVDVYLESALLHHPDS